MPIARELRLQIVLLPLICLSLCSCRTGAVAEGSADSFAVTAEVASAYVMRDFFADRPDEMSAVVTYTIIAPQCIAGREFTQYHPMNGETNRLPAVGDVVEMEVDMALLRKHPAN